MSADGSIVMATKESQELHFYTFTNEDYTPGWKKALNRRLHYNCDKAVSSREIVLQQNENTETVHFNYNMDKMHTFQRLGRLIDCWDDGCSVYMRRISDTSGCVLDLYGGSSQHTVTTLEAPAGCMWNRGLSVHSVADKHIVVEQCSKSLTIFSSQGIDFVIM